MHRSFLSRPAVIAASRSFVCIRLATYEDRDEAAFLKSLLRTRSGELENSVFALLASDGKTKLARAGRSPHTLYGNAEEMAAEMRRIAEKNSPRGKQQTLPTVANVRLGIDIAAADNQPLVIVVGKDKAARQAVEKQLAALAWGKEFVGHFVYTTAAPGKDLAAVAGTRPGAALLVVEPDKFGLKGKVLAQGGDERMAETLRGGLAAFSRQAAAFRSHVREGKQAGVLWATKIPVTDPMELRARQRDR